MAADEGWNVVGGGKKGQPKVGVVAEVKKNKPKPKAKAKAQVERPKEEGVTQNGGGCGGGIVITNLDEYEFRLNPKPTGYLLKGCLNHGNECYHNSVFQALLACPAFLNFSKSIPKGTLPPVLTSLQAVLQDFRGGPGTPANVAPLLSAMGRTFKQARSKEQADASEYLISLLSAVDDELNSVLPKPVSAVVADDGWETIGKGSKSRGVEHTTGLSGSTPVSAMFEGTISSRLASRGNKPSVTLQPFTVLPLDIINDKFASVNEFIKDWALPQNVDLPSGTGSKQMVFSSLPPILVLCLKLWFPTQEKATKKIQVTEQLSIHPSATTAHTKVDYTLAAVVCHRGGDVTKGHYTTVVRRGDKWALIDDVRVTQVAGLTSAMGDPYLLFYCRKS
eukprot:TRINITY_DN13177_c0_g1_i2.p1 TRINITY_DN13177_c0_g1~~TRINITY_DN13177_c0_g1_i2.p1  ORF type:complete len:392 (+),score=68.59 TRINITY_DN13177_c0_g1_i2:85-1260(+)